MRGYFKGRAEPPKVEASGKSVPDILSRLKDRRTATVILEELIACYHTEEYRIPLSEVLRILYLDSALMAGDLSRVVEEVAASPVNT